MLKQRASNIALRRLRVLPQFFYVLKLVTFVRLWLSFKGFEQTWQKFIGRQLEKDRAQSSRSEILRKIKLVTFAARFVPSANCLTQGLTLQKLLQEYGMRTRLVIGVRRDKKGHFGAHAWLTKDDVLLIGGPQSKIDEYSPINHFES